MLVCKTCGHESGFKDKICPMCNEKFTLDTISVKKALSFIQEAKKDKRFSEMLEAYRALADIGHTQSQIEYGKILELGELTPKNPELAKHYFYCAALKNNPYAIFKYSKLLSANDEISSRVWLVFSAVLGCEEAYPYTAMEFSSLGFEEDANYYYALAAACDDVDSIITLAKRYYEGVGTEKRHEYAKWYLNKLNFPPLYSLKLTYKLRKTKAAEPPPLLISNYTRLLNSLLKQARKMKFYTAEYKLCQMLWEKGDCDALARAGEMAFYGLGCAKDTSAGLCILKSAAQKKSKRAHLTLADIYLNGTDAQKNAPLAIEYLKEAGELGCFEAYTRIGDIYYGGIGVEKDIAKAVHFFDTATPLGSAEAQKKADAIKSERNKLFTSASAEKGSNPEKYFSLLSQSADMGHGGAALKLAFCFEMGNGVKINRRSAFSWYTRAVELNNTDALFPLAMCYANGVGTQRNYKKARTLLIKAESFNDCRAHDACLSLMDKKLKKVSRRLYSKAMRLLHLKKSDSARLHLETASDLLYPKAIYTLGCLYEFCSDGKKGKDKAFKLYEKAASLNFYDSRQVYKLKILKILRKI